MMRKTLGYVALGLGIMVLFLFGVYHHNHPLVFTIGSIEFIMIGAVLTTFVIAYSRRPWYKSIFGRAIMFSNASLAGITYLSLTNLVLGADWEYRPIVRAILFFPILITQIWMLRLMLRSPQYDDEPPEEVE